MALNAVADIRQRLEDYLQDVPVKINMPKDRPDTIVLVSRLGGKRQNKLIDRPAIIFYCYAPTEQEAWELANKTADYIDNLPFSEGYGQITQEIMYSDPDPDTRTPRWYMRYSIQTYQY